VTFSVPKEKRKSIVAEDVPVEQIKAQQSSNSNTGGSKWLSALNQER
jgi:hypothetical protein